MVARPEPKTVPPMPRLTALDHLVLTVRDIDQTLGFYCDALGMAKEVFHPADGSTRIALKFAEQKINLHIAGAEFEPKSRVPTPGSADLCFLTDATLADWQTTLTRHGIPVEQGPVARTGTTGPIISIYIRDPDGNLIELSQRG